MTTQNLTVTPLTTKGTKCYLYFDEKASAGDTILASGNAPTGQTTDWTNNGQGVTYYYTGANPDNWFYFGGFYWRIIRINGDGSIRMIYHGTGFNTIGSGTQIGESAFNNWYDNNMYVGFKYTSNQVHGTGTNSTILTTLNNWYSKNLADEAEYLDGNAGFCGDRRVSSGTGTGTSETYYQPYTRMSNSSPSLSCESPDIYTTSGSSTGNGALTYPIGLISADEAMFAGIPWSTDSNRNNYLYTGLAYWTMSPYWYNNRYADGLAVFGGGALNTDYVSSPHGVRPVINIRADVQIIGTGTSSDPYILS